MIRSLFIITADGGECIIEKHWRGSTSRAMSDWFMEQVAKHKKVEDVPPILKTPKYYVFSVFHRGLFFVASTMGETPPLTVFEWLHQVIKVFEVYFGPLAAGAITENFSIVYQLLEEMLDFGYPLLTEPNALTALIAPPSVASRVVGFVTGKSGVKETMGAGAMSMIPWRKSGVRYAQNEVFFDIVEEIDTIIDSNGQVVSTDAYGTVRCNCKLSGTPDLMLIFRETGFVDDAAFHPCVRYNRWERDRVLSFVPPDGHFELMTYRVNLRHLPMPLYCRPTVSYSDGGGRIQIMLGPKPIAAHASSSVKGMGSHATAAGSAAGAVAGAVASRMGRPSMAPGAGEPSIEEIMVTIVFPAGVRGVDLEANCGGIHYDAKANVAKWNIGRLPMDGRSPQLGGRMNLLPGAPRPEELVITNVHFNVPGTSVSGISVANFNMTGEAYKPYKGVRTSIRSGNFQIRS